MLLVAWLSMRAAIGNANEKYTKGYRSASTFTVYTEQGEDESELLSEMDAWEELSEPIRYAVMDLDKVLQSDTYVRTSNRFMTMVCEDQIHQGVDDNSFYPPSMTFQSRNNGRSIEFQVGFLLSDTLFCGACLEEYQYQNRKDSEYIEIFGAFQAAVYGRKIDEKIDADEFVADLKENFDYEGYKHYLIPHDQVYENAFQDDPRLYYEVEIRMTFANGFEIESFLTYCPSEGKFGIFSEDYNINDRIWFRNLQFLQCVFRRRIV